MPLDPDSIHVWREPDGDYHFEWHTSHPDTRVVVEPLAEPGRAHPGRADPEQPSAHYVDDDPGRARISGLPHDRRHYFRLRDQHGNEATSTERRFGLEGAPNFRDFGGYPTRDGGRVRWGSLYRSGQLSRLSDRDLDLLASLELDLVCDLRREDEQESEPSRLPVANRPRVVSLPIVPGSGNAMFEEHGREELRREGAMFDLMVDINRDLAEEQQATYARMFREILALEDARFLVHCAAGKDRTGFAAALVLLALGVAEELVLQDYLLTARYYHPEKQLERMRRKYGLDSLPIESLVPMLEVHPAYLERALQVISEGYESVEDYLENALGVGPAEREELRRRYLESG